MIFAIDGRYNTVKLDNGTEMENPIRIELSTVCTGQYTDFTISFPKGSTISRGKRKLAKNEVPIKIRVFKKGDL
jgi:hypothetical protein